MADRIGGTARRTDTPRIPPVTPSGAGHRIGRLLDRIGGEQR